MTCAPPKLTGMARDLAAIILRASVGSLSHQRTSCSCCGRTPVPGELVHVLASERVLCSLCLAELPEDERAPVRSERVHAGERRLAVVPRAA